MPCLDNFRKRLVGLALNFIVGDEVIPLDAEKHTETPLTECIDPACIFLGNRPTLWPIQENRQYTGVVESQLSWQRDYRKDKFLQKISRSGSSFWVIMLTDRQTDAGESITFLAEVIMLCVSMSLGLAEYFCWLETLLLLRLCLVKPTSYYCFSFVFNIVLFYQNYSTLGRVLQRRTWRMLEQEGHPACKISHQDFPKGLFVAWPRLEWSTKWAV